MNEAPQLNWAGQPVEKWGYGGRREHITEQRPTVVTETDLAAIFENGSLPLAQAAKQLQALTGASRASCYRCLDLKGRFAKRLTVENGMLAWRK